MCSGCRWLAVGCRSDSSERRSATSVFLALAPKARVQTPGAGVKKGRIDFPMHVSARGVTGVRARWVLGRTMLNQVKPGPVPVLVLFEPGPVPVGGIKKGAVPVIP